jgi:hypothetical protein
MTYKIEEVPNPAYKKAMQDKKSSAPVKASIRTTSLPMQPSLGEQMMTREKRYALEILTKVCDICEYCPNCSDCSWSCEVRAVEYCDRIKRNLIYIGVIEK